MYKNNIDLIGFVGSDPEARYTSNGTAVATFSLATKSSWKNEAGMYENRTEWHRIVTWSKLAESAAKLAKGDACRGRRRMRHRTYQKEISVGKKTVTVDVPITEVHVCTLRKLDRSGNQNDAELKEEAPEYGALR